MTAPKKAKVKAPKPPKPKRTLNLAPLKLLIPILLLGGAAYAVYTYPIPGLTAPPKGAQQAPSNGSKSASGQPAVQMPPVKDPQSEREANLAKKEAELASREETLKQNEAKINSLLKELTVQQTESEAIRRISGIYGAMAPSKAAPILEGFDVPAAAQILRLLNEDQAAAILAGMQPDRAAAITKEMLKPSGAPAQTTTQAPGNG